MFVCVDENVLLKVSVASRHLVYPIFYKQHFHIPVSVSLRCFTQLLGSIAVSAE